MTVNTRRKPFRAAMTALLLAPILLGTAGAPARAQFSEDEIRMGREAAKEIEKEYKVVTDEAIVKRVVDMGQALVKVSSAPKAEFTFKVLAEKEVNAFALPGGFVYVYKGLLDKVESDHELAGVLAHEIVHATHHHTQKILKKQKPFDIASMGVLLAGILSGKDVTGLAQGVSILNMAKINGYTIELEKESDAGGMEIMLKSEYNPTGMLTFMERLARQDARSGAAQVDYGIFRTHPYSEDRASALRDRLEKAGVDVSLNRRLVTKSVRVIAEPVTGKEAEAATLKMGSQSVITLAADGGTSAIERAKAVAERMNQMLDKDLRFNDVDVSKSGTEVMGRDTALIRVSESDAQLAGQPRARVAEDAAKKIKNVLWSEYLRWNS